MSDYIIRMQGIVKDFPGTRALNQVNLEIKRGEVHALLGENGAGKSTLMNILLGVLKRDEGTIEYDGKALQVRTPTEALRLGISMVPQELNLVPEASVAENIFLGDIKRDNRKPINWKQVNERAGQVMDELGLAGCDETGKGFKRIFSANGFDRTFFRLRPEGIDSG